MTVGANKSSHLFTIINKKSYLVELKAVNFTFTIKILLHFSKLNNICVTQLVVFVDFNLFFTKQTQSKKQVYDL